MKQSMQLGRSLSKQEQKKITGGCLIPNGICNCSLIGQSCATRVCCVYPGQQVQCVANTCVSV